MTWQAEMKKRAAEIAFPGKVVTDVEVNAWVSPGDTFYPGDMEICVSGIHADRRVTHTYSQGGAESFWDELMKE